VNSLPDLLYVSIVCGLAYGGVWTITPVLVGKLFGERNFALNWGWMTVIPAFGGPFFSYIFGAIFDNNSKNQLCKGIDYYL
jgi:MFS family permease